MSEENGTTGSQGDTGAATGEGTGTSFVDSLGDDLKGNEIFTGIEDAPGLGTKYADLHKSHEDLKSNLPQVPESADKYEFNVPEGVSIEFSKEGVDSFQASAHEAGYTQAQYDLAVSAALKRDQELVDQYNTQRQETVDGIKQEYGDKFDANVELAKKAAGDAAPENVDDLVASPLFKRLVFLGSKISEDNLGEGAGQSGGSGDTDDTAGVMFGDMVQKK
ncbi:hypothetical protein KAR91_11965 [Candidatus Pacearchaeota archaeon]|nr:hypothetical protein [Candidatus Pacearchaeota archaeon]